VATQIHLAETREIFPERFVIRVIGILFDDSYNLVFRDKAREVIDMTVGVIALDSIAEP
jgi:hypothetical protein